MHSSIVLDDFIYPAYLLYSFRQVTSSVKTTIEHKLHKIVVLMELPLVESVKGSPSILTSGQNLCPSDLIHSFLVLLTSKG